MELTIRGDIHPYYGAEGFGPGAVTECETLDELIAMANDYDEDMNFVYRWDWQVPSAQDVEYAVEDGEDREEASRETLTLFVILQRKSRIVNWICPVTAEDEAKVREFLASDRILGALRRTWSPLLEES